MEDVGAIVRFVIVPVRVSMAVGVKSTSTVARAVMSCLSSASNVRSGWDAGSVPRGR